jgi:hypothetical protein
VLDQERSAPFVVPHLIGLFVPGAVDLDRQLPLVTIEIEDVGPEWMLSAEFQPSQSGVSQLTPEQPFRQGRSATQAPRTLYGFPRCIQGCFRRFGTV